MTFSSLMLTARSFAAKNGYDVDADQDFAALGAANVASAVVPGLCCQRSGLADRRERCGAGHGRKPSGSWPPPRWRSCFFSSRLPCNSCRSPRSAPFSSRQALSLIDIASLRLIYRIDPHRSRCSRSLPRSASLPWAPVNAILFAVMLALLRFIKLMSRPPRGRFSARWRDFPASTRSSGMSAGQSHSRPAPVSLQCADHVLQCALLQAGVNAGH